MIPKHALELHRAIKATGKKLSTKDSGFLSSISIQAKQDRKLTDSQTKYLQDIYAKVTGGGMYQDKEHIR